MYALEKMDLYLVRVSRKSSAQFGQVVFFSEDKAEAESRAKRDHSVTKENTDCIIMFDESGLHEDEIIFVGTELECQQKISQIASQQAMAKTIARDLAKLAYTEKIAIGYRNSLWALQQVAK